MGYITQLWKDSKDIEFVKQTIGHRNLDTTSSYVNKLSDQEQQKRIDLFILRFNFCKFNVFKIFMGFGVEILSERGIKSPLRVFYRMSRVYLP